MLDTNYYKKTLQNVLPKKQTKVMVVFKGVKSNTYSVEGVPYSFNDMIVTFEFLNGFKKDIVVPQIDFIMLQICDEGILIYKKRGRIYFLSVLKGNNFREGVVFVDKKVFNWLGYILISFYTCILYILNLISFNIYNDDIRFLFQLFIGLYFCTLLGLIPFTLQKTWYRILPNKTAYAQLIASSLYRENVYSPEGSNTINHHSLIFEFSDGTRKAFPASKKNDTIVLFEKGLLTFKEQGRRIFFVSFERE
jgi:hypothetical protein